jgi:hypothetical protein
MGDLLFLAHRVPYPPDRGDKIRSYNILKHLAGRHRVHLAAFADDEADFDAAQSLIDLVASCHIERRTRSKRVAAAIGLAMGSAISVAAFGSGGMSRFVDSVLAEEPIDRVYVFSGQMALYAPADRPFIMDFVDMDSEKFAAYGAGARGLMRWAWRRASCSPSSARPRAARWSRCSSARLRRRCSASVPGSRPSASPRSRTGSTSIIIAPPRIRRAPRR